MTKESPQKILFDKLKDILPADKSLAECLMGWLNVSSDSVYRRIRGETPLTVNELAAISEATGLTANELLGMSKPNQVMFEPSFAKSVTNGFANYISQIVQHLQSLQHFENKQVLYCSKDLPIFHFFQFPELAAFKYHFWMHVILQDPTFQERTFDGMIADAEVQLLLQQALDSYYAVPAIEVWNTESVNSTLFQIDFYKHSRFFGSAQEIKHLYDVLDDLISHVELEAEWGTMYKPGSNPELFPKNFQLFFNQVSLSDNTMLAQAGNRKTVVINYGVLNYLICYDQVFCNSVDEDLQNIIRRSTKLSEANVKQRVMFFNALHDKVNRYRKLI
ncbi:MAG TPA: hypothetical protein VLC98_11055 [Phnomibacter sp.]|nr:hypothetical protein [Phnomibacter sp.]